MDEEASRIWRARHMEIDTEIDTWKRDMDLVREILFQLEARDLLPGGIWFVKCRR